MRSQARRGCFISGDGGGRGGRGSARGGVVGRVWCSKGSGSSGEGRVRWFDGEGALASSGGAFIAAKRHVRLSGARISSRHGWASERWPGRGAGRAGTGVGRRWRVGRGSAWVAGSDWLAGIGMEKR